MLNTNQALMRVVGLLMQVPGVMALLSIPICLWFQEFYAILPFVITAALSLGSGQILYRRYRQHKSLRYRQTLVIVALSWAIIFAMGTIPFLLVGASLPANVEVPPAVQSFQNGWNALFESISGLTTTGLTIVDDASQLPHCLQWWRSLSQWVGGIGLIVLTLSVLEPSANVQQLYSAEAREDKLAPTFRETAQEIGRIYLLYTVGGIFLLRLVGMPLWAAINHSLSGIATGGFAITGSSFEEYSPIVQLAIVPIMMAGAISFTVHAQIIRRRRFAALWTDSRYQVFWTLLTLGIGLLLLERYWQVGTWEWVNSIFQWVSALTTSGFSTVDVGGLSPVVQILMAIAMVFGSASGSTAGGLKLDRVAILYKAVVWHLGLIYHESPEDLRYELDNQLLSEQEAHRRLNFAVVLAMLWFATLGVGTLILFHTLGGAYTLGDAFFECASALGTSGLSVGITQPNLFWPGKVTLMLLMWLGRLEIVAVLVFFAWLTRPLSAILPQAQRHQKPLPEDVKTDSETPKPQ